MHGQTWPHVFHTHAREEGGIEAVDESIKGLEREMSLHPSPSGECTTSPFTFPSSIISLSPRPPLLCFHFYPLAAQNKHRIIMIPKNEPKGRRLKPRLKVAHDSSIDTRGCRCASRDVVCHIAFVPGEEGINYASPRAWIEEKR